MWLEIRLETYLGARTSIQGHAEELAFIWWAGEGLQAVIWLNACYKNKKQKQKL